MHFCSLRTDTRRLGYGGLFLERRKLLEIMGSRVTNKDAIRTSARVVSLQETSDGVTITASDGSSFDASLVIGADGVRSCVRDAIERSVSGKDKIQSDSCMYSSFHAPSLRTPCNIPSLSLTKENYF